MSARDDAHRRVLDNYPLHLDLQLRFGDCDMQGHLNNAAAARLYEEARIRFLTKLRRESLGGRGTPPMVAHLAIDYLSEGHYPGDLTVGVGIVVTGRTSYRIGKGLFQNGRCIGLCDAVMANMGETGPTPLSAEHRAAYERWTIGTATQHLGGGAR